MDMATLKGKLVYLWMLLLLAAMYTARAYEQIYYLKNEVNFPHSYTVFWILVVAFILTLVVIAIMNRKNIGKSETSFGYSFAIAFTASVFSNIVRSKADNIIKFATDTDKAVSDIIMLYLLAYTATVVICVFLDYTQSKRKNFLNDKNTSV